MKLTRRELIAGAGSGAVLEQPERLPQTPEEELALAAQQQRRDLEAIEKFKVPMSVEPAFRFEA